MNTKAVVLNKKNFLVLAVSLCIALIFSLAPLNSVQAQTNNSSESELIQTLLAQLAILQEQLNQLLKNGTTGSGNSGIGSVVSQCNYFTRSLYVGATDATTGGEVTKLQQYLTSTGDYTYGKTTGYYGPATLSAVQKWQAKNGVVSYGTPDTTGYGLVGTKTRAALNKRCGAITPSEVEMNETDITAEITSISDSTSPRVEGRAYGTKTIGLSITDYKASGDKIYGSGIISVVNNKWSHKVSVELNPGQTYQLVLYIGDEEVDRETFTIDDEEEDENITDSENGPIEVVYPQEGMVLKKGVKSQIGWLTTGPNASYRVSFEGESSEGLVGTYSAVAAGCSASEKCYISWTPSLVSGKTQIQVTDTVTGSEGVSDDFYVITNDPSDTGITLLSPNGGEVLDVGDEYVISWDTESYLDAFDVHIGITDTRFTVSGNGIQEIIANQTQNDGKYTWRVPETLGSINFSETENAVYKIAIVSHSVDSGGIDFSDEPFTILSDNVSACYYVPYDYNNDGILDEADSDFLEDEIISGNQQCPAGKLCDTDYNGSLNSSDVQKHVYVAQELFQCPSDIDFLGTAGNASVASVIVGLERIIASLKDLLR